MKKALTCNQCLSKPCRNTPLGTFDICEFGVSFYKRRMNQIETKEPNVPLNTIAKNLRHEINPILQTIIQQAVKLDENLSTKSINLNNPLSVIIGSTLILDNFIQMISGVHELHSSPLAKSSKKTSLKQIVDRYFTLYKILQEEGRSENLTLLNNISERYLVQECSDIVEYIIAILIDNAWKYSTENSILRVDIRSDNTEKIELIMSNHSMTLPQEINIFNIGSKANENSKGFGFGLSWAKVLEANYNTLVNQNNIVNPFSINHFQIPVKDSDLSIQYFQLLNIKIIDYEA